MLSYLKKYFQQALIVSLVIIMLSASIISWGKILSKKQQGIEEPLAQVEAQKASSKIKRGVMVFSGLMIVVAEYFQMKDDE